MKRNLKAIIGGITIVGGIIGGLGYGNSTQEEYTDCGCFYKSTDFGGEIKVNGVSYRVKTDISGLEENKVYCFKIEVPEGHEIFPGIFPLRVTEILDENQTDILHNL